MPDRHSSSSSLFRDPREALGWVVTQWAGLLVASLVMAWLLEGRLVDVELPTWSQLALIGSLLVLAGLNLWGYMVSSSARPRLQEATRQVPWWGRDRFVSEHAAERLAWPGPAVVWTRRLLLFLAVAVTTSTVVVVVQG